MKQVKILKCNHCGNIILMLEDKGVPISCCNEKMHLLNANTSDGATEKHVPVVVNPNKETTKSGAIIGEVQVGSTLHPMLTEHYINWIGSFSDNAWVIKWLKPNDAPKCNLRLNDNASIYEYCNIHGLWKK